MIVVGGDPVVGRSLEVLLQAAGYDARSHPKPAADGLDELLVDAGVLLVGPALSAEARNALTDVVIRTATKIPILELLPASEGEAVGIQGADAVPWPCPLEALQQRIQAALLHQG